MLLHSALPRDSSHFARARAEVAGGGRITVTIGIAAYPQDGVETDTLMRAADRRLYHGKDAGRDRFVAA